MGSGLCCEHFPSIASRPCRGTFLSTLPTGRTHALYAVSAGVRSTRNEDGGIVLDIDHGQMFRLNPVGALILESIGKGCAETEIAKEISRQCSIGEETAWPTCASSSNRSKNTSLFVPIRERRLHEQRGRAAGYRTGIARPMSRMLYRILLLRNDGV